MSAMPTSITSLRTGAVSVTFHIPFEQAERAWEFHKMQGKSVRVDVYLEDG